MEPNNLNSLLELHRPQFEIYSGLLIKWNKAFNLTAIKTPQEIWKGHFSDSIIPLPYLPEEGHLLDIGTGAGFPGIPLKIVRPNLNITLIEATLKKCNFCEEVIRKLGLKNIKVIHRRIEDKNLPQELGEFDAIISRATFSLSKLIANALPYSKNNSIIIAIKGADIAAELKEAQSKFSDLKFKVISYSAKGKIVIISR